MLTRFISWLFRINTQHEAIDTFNSIRINAIVKQLSENGVLDTDRYEGDVEIMIIELLDIGTRKEGVA